VNAAGVRFDGEPWEAPVNREPSTADVFLPHVVAWNLTRRCNLRCSHCYISAGPEAGTADELDTAACRRIVDQLLAVNPSPMLILSGGEPLLREDLPEIAGYATGRGATVVVGTNGTLLTDERISALQQAGVTGVAVSVDSLTPAYHDRFRRGDDALAATLAALERLRARRLDFIVQSTATRGNLEEVPALLAWAADQGATAFNCYFLVPTGRGGRLTDLTADQVERLLGVLVDAERRHRGAMMVRAKCAPHFIRRLREAGTDSPVLNYATRCPCGLQYCRITPAGRLTPCPYIPAEAGDLTTQSFAEVWRDSPLFGALRRRELGGRCGRCEYRLICGGCRARALAATGDVLAEDPSCAYQPTGAAPLIPRPSLPYGSPAAPTLAWTPEAEARMARIPSFVRGVVVRRVEDFARARGLATITPELLSEIRRAMPLDFSRRLPFFARHD
jgi:radical SAM protein with 4Fe4S-binding SPASM domain